MPIDPMLGYDPAQNSGAPTTREQWIIDTGISMAQEFAQMRTDSATTGAMSAELFARAGVALPDPRYNGIQNPLNIGGNRNNALPPSVSNAMFAVAAYLANNPSEAITAGFTPSPTISGGPVLSAADQQNKFNATQNAAGNASAERISAGNNATSRANQASSDATSRANNAESNATSRANAGLQAQVDRESIAAQTSTANLDRTSRETISTADRVERGREFDISTVEDRRQFNATMVFNLFDRAVDLAKAPVDWLGYQYFMQNLGIPMTYLNATSAATMFGAVPPTGPSSVGPVVGGPAALDGDGALAAQVGVQPALVPVSQAVQQFGGSAQVPGMEQYTATNMLGQWVQQAGGAQQLDAMVAQERATVLPQVVGDNPVIQQAIQQAQQAAPAPLTADQSQMPPIPYGNDNQVTQATTPGQQIGFGNDQQLNQVQPAPAPTAAPAIPGGAVASIMPPVPGAAPAPQSTTTGGNTGTDRGVFTGATQTTPAAGATSAFGAPMTGTGTTNPQGDQMLQALSDSLGIPFDQLKQIVPVNLLAGGYSLDTIKNSPVIQALQNPNGPGLGYYRTAAVDGSKFGNIQAFGVPLGIRGGQDVNAQTYLQAPQATQQMMEGAITATGQSWPDVQAQMFRSSPLTNYTPGAFGKRRFAA